MLSEEAVQHIAHLARLNLTDEEAAMFSQQLSAILDSFNDISKVETQGIEPLVTPIAIVQHLRADRVEHHGTTEELLSNAPDQSGHLFKVPPVV